MNNHFKGTLAVAQRILASVRGDRRTIGIVVGAPVLIIFLFAEVFEQFDSPFVGKSTIAPIILGVFVFFLTYLLTAIGFLRERQAGTFERVLASPISRNAIVLGYVLGYGVVATVQSIVLLLAGLYFLEIEFEHGIVFFFGLELLGAMTALGIGIVLSLFARNEFQVIQFIPVVITPQVILGDVFVPIEDLPVYLEIPARVMPITYLIKGMEYVVLDQGEASDLWLSVGVLVGFAVASVLVAGLGVRRTR
ncbi:MAG: ABC transporter permease [Halobacteria archaeon]|nr:ABC transporter permease [Halobacteria archaeon]